MYECGGVSGRRIGAQAPAIHNTVPDITQILNARLQRLLDIHDVLGTQQL